MVKTTKERISNKISFIRKVAKGFLKIDKFAKDMKYSYHDIKPTKREHNPKAVKNAVLKRDNYRCVKCGSTRNLEIDHKVPLAKGRSGNKPEDLQVLCKDCNRRKGVS